MKAFAKIGLVIVAIVAGILILRVLLHDALSAKRPPGTAETFLARRVRQWTLPNSVKQSSNPFKPSPQLLTEARQHFADHCATCHGNDGSGKTSLGENLNPPAPDMRLAATQSMSDGELYYVIHNGIRFTGMPAWGNEEPDNDSWKLVLFIRHLPQLTTEEIKDMEKYNPKSETERLEQQEEEDFLSGKPVSPSANQHSNHH